MTLNEEIINAMMTLGFAQNDIAPTVYTGESLEYIVFNYNISPSAFGDDYAMDAEYDIQIHYVCPHSVNRISKRANIRRVIENTFGDYPTETNASDEDGQHFVYEFSVVRDAHDGETV